MHATLLVRPEVFVGFAAQKFAAQGHCTDAAARSFVPAQIAARVRPAPRQQRRLALD